MFHVYPRSPAPSGSTAAALPISHPKCQAELVQCRCSPPSSQIRLLGARLRSAPLHPLRHQDCPSRPVQVPFGSGSALRQPRPSQWWLPRRSPSVPARPSRSTLPRARAGFARAAPCTPPAAVSYPPRRLESVLRAVAVDADQQGSAEPPEQAKKPQTYYFVVANAKFLLDEEEHFQEQLAEKLRLYGERGMERDFWLVVEPKFLDRFPSITKRLKRPAVALVSTDGNWITFMKLRLDRVLADQFDAESVEEALASNPVELKFEKPEKWTAPYAKYEFGWWKPFLPPMSSNGTA